MALQLRSTAGRAVQLRIFPRVSSLAESREIMNLMSKFGQLQYFKYLRYDKLSAPYTFLCIFKDQEGAERCLRKSPIRFRMDQAGVSGASPAGEDAAESAQPPIDSESEGSEARFFELHVNESRANFRDLIDHGPFHGQVPPDQVDIAGQDLRRSAPLPGLGSIDWRSRGPQWKDLADEKKREHHGPERRRTLQEVFDQPPDFDAKPPYVRYYRPSEYGSEGRNYE